MLDLVKYRLPGYERQYRSTPRNRAVLIIVQRQKIRSIHIDETKSEMKELCRTAGIEVVAEVSANVPSPSPGYFIRSGKLDELKLEASRSKADSVIFNVDLSPAQAANVELFLGIPAYDRTGLILNIFARRARTREGNLQVELAQLSYALPRIGGLGTVLSRTGGGIGTRGPGEQMLERDRRKIRNRIQQVKKELEKVRSHRQLLRVNRQRKRLFSVSLVGYTNAGKSTLLNAMTGANVHVEDKLFATLDPTVRVQNINGRDDIVFIDTVGFLQDLPHTLIEAFQATLEEVAESTLILHVLDVAHPAVEQRKETVEKVLKEIHADARPVLLVMNKADMLDENDRKAYMEKWPDAVLVSARERHGLKGLMSKVENRIELYSGKG